MLDGGARKVVRDAERLSSKELARVLLNHFPTSQAIGTNNATIEIPTLSHAKFTYAVYKSSEMKERSRDQVMDLCATNMKALYEATPGGWNASEKRTELFHRTSRFVIVTAKGDDALSGFVNWRFDEEECERDDPCSRNDECETIEVAYCYELQVSPSVQRCGVGRMLIEMLETIGRATSMRKVMLTVFKNNDKALAFYRRNNYTIDRISPSQFSQSQGGGAGNDLGEYEIMSKSLLPFS